MTSLVKLGDSQSEVAVGTDGYLYLVGGAQSVLDYIACARPIGEQALRRFATNLEGRSTLGSELGINYVHCVCPDKHSVIPEHFPFEIKINLANEFRKRCRTPFIYPAAALRACGDSFGYLKTDTHWNFSGRVAVARAILSELGVDQDKFESRYDLVLGLRKSYDRYCGDLGNKLDPSPFETADVSVTYHDGGSLTTFSNSIAGNNGLINVIFNSDFSGDRRLLVFGDSFILHCLQMLAVFFRETFFIRSPYLHREIVGHFQPTHLITSNAERYLPNTTFDADAPLGLLMAGLAGKAWNSDPIACQAINAALQPRSAHNRNFWTTIGQAR